MSVARERELIAWKPFKAIKRSQDGTHSKSFVDRGWALTRKMEDGEKDGKVRLSAKGYREPDLRDGRVDTSGRVRLRSSTLRDISLGSIIKKGDSVPGHAECLPAGRWIWS